MGAIVLLFAIITAFSLLTVGEIFLLRHLGFDIIGHLKVTHQTGKGSRFFFEAFGVVAFVLVQPAVLTWLLVWLSNNINPGLLKPLLMVLPPIKWIR